jgi:hypothetical protein
MNGPADWEKEEERLAAASLAAHDPTGWFDQLYAAGGQRPGADALEPNRTAPTTHRLGAGPKSDRRWPSASGRRVRG